MVRDLEVKQVQTGAGELADPACLARECIEASADFPVILPQDQSRTILTAEEPLAHRIQGAFLARQMLANQLADGDQEIARGDSSGGVFRFFQDAGEATPQ